MDGKTHAALGTAVALCVAQPKEPLDVTLTILVGAFTGILPDIDTKDSRVQPIMYKITFGFVVLMLCFAAVSFVQQNSVLELMNNSGHAAQLLGVAILIAFSLYGSKQPHRGFTHSLIAAATASFSAVLLYSKLTFAFVLGYMSHLAIDLLNMKGEQLLWPLDKRFCFKLCTASGRIADITRLASYLIATGYAVLLTRNII